jgi:hypothetical protein
LLLVVLRQRLTTALSISYQAEERDAHPMPRTASTAQPAWARLVRDHLRRAFTTSTGKPEPGWYVGGYRSGGAYLQHRSKGGAEVVALPYRWAEADAADLMQRISVIAKLMQPGDLPLAQAAAKAEGRSSRAIEDWDAALAAFRQHKLNFGRRPCSASNFEVMQMRYLAPALALLQGAKPPRNATDLLERLAVSNPRWQPGTVSRGQAVTTVSRFLRHCVSRQGFAARWLPPDDLATIKGGSLPHDEPVGLGDREILALLATLDDPQLVFLLQVMAVYGCRPADARVLELRGGRFFSGYRKAAGGGSTQPRYLRPLLLRDAEGQPVQWNLEARWQIGERFPDLGPKSWGEGLNRRLRYHRPWQELVRIYAENGKALKVSYCFRHGYVRRGQLRQIPPKVLADACGHSLQTHLTIYSMWDSERDAGRYFDAPPLLVAPDSRSLLTQHNAQR